MCYECDLNWTFGRKYLCIQCRTFHCHLNEHPKVAMNWRWRIPKKNNEKAWHLIENGDFLWDKKAISRKLNKKKQSQRAWR